MLSVLRRSWSSFRRPVSQVCASRAMAATDTNLGAPVSIGHGAEQRASKRLRVDILPTASAEAAVSQGTAGLKAAEPAKRAAALGDVTIMPLHNKSSEEEFDRVVSVVATTLAGGKVVGLPTDTIYGVACLAQLTPAINRIYAIKGRDGAKPIAICVAETSDLAKYATVTVSQELLDELLPGPVTLCFKRSSALNPELNPTSDTIGIRIPDNRFIRALTAACDTALALTSANLSGQPSSVEVNDFKEIWTDLGVIVDAGCRGHSRLGSTVVDLSQPSTFLIVRAGDSAKETIACLLRHGLTQRE